jgi:hypothetical protein
MRSGIALALGMAVLVLAAPAHAGGAFESIVGVGAGGRSVEITLQQTGPRSEASLTGREVSVPSGGYVRVYPFIGGLPAIPGRFYARERVLCLYWREPVSNCVELTAAGSHLLAPIMRLPLRTGEPTRPTRVSFQSRILRYADGNIFAALELAFERSPRSVAPAVADGAMISVAWKGPDAAIRPTRLLLDPHGVSQSGRLFPLPRGVWCYLTANLPPTSASLSLIEASARICHP